MTMGIWKLGLRSWGWRSCVLALLSFCAGSLMTARLMRVHEVRAESERVYELRIYHCLPGKLPAMEARFRDTTSKLLAKHDLNVVGYWTAEPGAPEWNDTFVFLLAHASREEAKKNWDAMRADPGFQEVIQAEQREPMLDELDVTYLGPTDFSPMK
ncbi:MAG: NIPSNAP family protein [Acidobacteriaceae bacterium]